MTKSCQLNDLMALWLMYTNLLCWKLPGHCIAPNFEVDSRPVVIPATHGRIMLIVADINLPGRLNGIDLALAANARRPDVAVIFMSGRPAMFDEARMVCAGASFFQKPFNFKDFVDETRRVTVSSSHDEILSAE